MKFAIGTIHKLADDVKVIQGLNMVRLNKGQSVKITAGHGFGMVSVLPTDWEDWACRLVIGNHPVIYTSDLEP